MQTLSARILAVLLAAAVPAAPALCKASPAGSQEAPPPCHAATHPGSDSPQAPASDCCVACEDYVVAQAASDLNPVWTWLLVTFPALHAPLPFDLTRFGDGDPPPDDVHSPFTRNNRPLRS